jgi:hypothetical protein
MVATTMDGETITITIMDGERTTDGEITTVGVKTTTTDGATLTIIMVGNQTTITTDGKIIKTKVGGIKITTFKEEEDFGATP